MSLTLIKDYDDLPLIFNDLYLSSLPQATQAQIYQIEQVLPQTQCGLCGYADGCLPYAHAIATKDEAINLCVPGGNAVSRAISTLTNRPYLPAKPSVWLLDERTARPQEVRAIIREDECIGCIKCISACPVDAIIGTAKHSHSVLAELCTGCELCLPPCPVDCIELVPYPRMIDDKAREQEQQSLKQRYHAHLRRTEKNSTATSPVVSVRQSKVQNALQSATIATTPITSDTAKDAIAAAKLRTQLKKLNKQLSTANDNQKADLTQKIRDLTEQLQALC